MHPACKACIEARKKKFGEAYSSLQCSGIKEDVLDGLPVSEYSEPEKEHLRDLLDVARWAKKQLGMTLRPYQELMAKCTALRKVSRCGRQIGKSETLAIATLHYAFTHSDKKVLFIAPQEAQIKLIFERFEKWRSKSTEINDSVLSFVKDPYTLKFRNGTQILGMTAGTKSGMGASNIRGQSADVVILDEADYLSPEDINTIMMILKKTDEAEDYSKTLWSSSTPTGAHGFFYKWCNSERFKEFHFRSQDAPTWGPEEESFFLDIYGSKDTADWLHEVEADFGEQVQGVYPHAWVDRARELAERFFGTGGRWDYSKQLPRAGCIYVMGVDWNSARNGVQIVIIEYDTSLVTEEDFALGIKGRFRVVYRESVGDIEYVQTAAVNRIIELNYMWNPRHIYVDQGFGYQQVEDLRRHGHKKPESKLLTKVVPRDMGSMLEVRDPHTKQPVKKHMKPFMVNNSRMFFEKNLIVLNKGDKELEKQLRDYIIDHTTVDGRPVYAKGNDHVLDAFNLAILAYTMEFTDLGRPIYATNMRIAGRFGEKTHLTPSEFPEENPDGSTKVIDKTASKNSPIVAPRDIPVDSRTWFNRHVVWNKGKYSTQKFNRPTKRAI
jgi:hypothetical protein